MAELTPENVRAFVDRDWSAARRVKDEGLSRWVLEHGTTAAFRLSQSLLDQVLVLKILAGRDKISKTSGSCCDLGRKRSTWASCANVSECSPR